MVARLHAERTRPVHVKRHGRLVVVMVVLITVKFWLAFDEKFGVEFEVEGWLLIWVFELYDTRGGAVVLARLLVFVVVFVVVFPVSSCKVHEVIKGMEFILLKSMCFEAFFEMVVVSISQSGA